MEEKVAKIVIGIFLKTAWKLKLEISPYKRKISTTTDKLEVVKSFLRNLPVIPFKGSLIFPMGALISKNPMDLFGYIDGFYFLVFNKGLEKINIHFCYSNEVLTVKDVFNNPHFSKNNRNNIILKWIAQIQFEPDMILDDLKDLREKTLLKIPHSRVTK